MKKYNNWATDLSESTQTELEPAMQQWYNELFAKMVANGYDAQMGKNKPRYLELLLTCVVVL